MPRNGDGTYSLPSGTIVASGETILPSQHNPAFNDVAEAIGNSIDRDGRGGMRAPLNMGGNIIQNAAPGVAGTDLATVSQLTGSNFPPGFIGDFAGPTAPSGWLLCGGQSVSRTTFAALFAVIGTTYGSVDGNSFNLPDARGRVSAGLDYAVGGVSANRLTSTTLTPNGTTLGATGGSQTHTLTEAQIPAHAHGGVTSTTGAHTHPESGVSGSVPVPDGTIAYSAGNPTPTMTGSAGDHSHTIPSSGGGQAHPSVQPTILFNKIIKT